MEDFEVMVVHLLPWYLSVFVLLALVLVCLLATKWYRGKKGTKKSEREECSPSPNLINSLHFLLICDDQRRRVWYIDRCCIYLYIQQHGYFYIIILKWYKVTLIHLVTYVLLPSPPKKDITISTSSKTIGK